jgi:3',5'-cyclic AMP phosphodiesterase CpdA
MRIAHLSDLHVSSPQGVDPRRLLGKRVTGYANWRLRRSAMHRSEYVRLLAEEIARQGVDHVVVTGDVTNLALEQEFDLARETLRASLGGDASRVSIVPGNHDLYTAGAERDRRFATRFADYMASDVPSLRVSVPGGMFPFVRLRGPVAIIGLSSAVARPPMVASGALGRAQIHALARVLDHEAVRARTPVIALHHPVHDPDSWLKGVLEGLTDAADLRSVLRCLSRGIVLHGHLHRRVRRAVETAQGSIPSVGATSASLHHEDADRAAGFNVYELDDAGTVTHIDAHVLEPAHGTFRVFPIAQAAPHDASGAKGMS